MDSMGLTRYMSVLMDDAMKQARFFDHEFVMPEHMLLSLLRQYAFCQALQEEGVDSIKMHEDLVGWLAKQERVPENIKFLPEPSSLFKTMFGTACALAAAADRKLVNVPHFVQAMFGLQNSEAAFLLCKNVGDRQGEFLASVDSYYPLENEPGDETLLMGDGYDEDDYDNDYDEDEEEGRSRQPQDWHQLVTCISDQVEEHNPLIGREQELDRTIQVLCRAEKNNPLHIGEPGVGKTAVVYGLARLLNEDKVPEPLKGAKIYALDLGTLLAGTQYRGDFEKRFEEVMAGISREEKPIVYLDEIHNVVGAGAVGGGSFDIANMLKPYLAGGRIRFIGATTYEEYKKYFEKSKSLVRRFQNVEIREPSAADTVEILKGLKKYYEKFHGVRYGKGVIEYAVDMSSRYVKERFLPDKAIDLIDEAGAYRTMHPLAQKTQSVGKEVISEILSKTCQIPKNNVEQDESVKLKYLEEHLSARIFGQEEAVRQVVNAVKFSRAGLLEEGKPLASLLFVGPTGVGKTEIARSLADELGISLLRFDMSEYGEKHSVAKLIGSPAGYVGYEEGGLLTEAVRKTPRAVLLLDEIEKAHPDIYNILLQVMDYATLTDNQGRKADFRNIILIMTSNAGASQLGKAAIGFGDRVFRRDAIEEEVKRTFQPEFRNRLSRVVVFGSMNEKMAEQIAGKKLGELCEMLKQKKTELSIEPEALKLLIKKGTSEEFGAREMDRVINGEIKPLLVDELLFGRLKHGGEAVLETEKESFRLHIRSRKKTLKKDAS